jgi:hypothetical protein
VSQSEAASFKALPDRFQQFFTFKRLRQEIRRACLDRTDRHGNIAVAREKYDGNLSARLD